MTDKSYQQLRTELDELLLSLQDTELDVEKASASYEQGIKLVAELEKRLQFTQNKVEKIKLKFERQ